MSTGLNLFYFQSNLETDSADRCAVVLKEEGMNGTNSNCTSKSTLNNSHANNGTGTTKPKIPRIHETDGTLFAKKIIHEK